MFDTPVLLILFNRPDKAQRVFSAIREIKPRQLFVAADGPRVNKPTDIERCAATRRVIDQVDWACELYTLFREENRGCGYGPAEAITWFFSHVEEGIILEDDCLPDQSFFPYCAELLARYRTNESIGIISGTNQLKQWKQNKQSYIFSVLGGTWGWASWRRAWMKFDYSALAWHTDEGKSRVRTMLKSERFYSHFEKEFTTYFAEERSDVWDFQWYFARLYMGGNSIVPTVNLISNIGFDGDGTHTFTSKTTSVIIPVNSLQFPIVHPKIKIDSFYDWYVFERFISQLSIPLWKKILFKLIKIITQTN
jgi:hypothetical protein